LNPLACPPSDIQEEEKEEEKRRRGSATTSAPDTTHTTDTAAAAAPAHTHAHATPANVHAESKPTTAAAAVHAGSTDNHPGAAQPSAAPAQLTRGGQAARVQRQSTVVGHHHHHHQSSADEQHFDRAIRHKAPVQHDEQTHHCTRDKWYRDRLRYRDKREEQALE
jgi:hypothetical protein